MFYLLICISFPFSHFVEGVFNQPWQPWAPHLLGPTGGWRWCSGDLGSWRCKKWRKMLLLEHWDALSHAILSGCSAECPLPSTSCLQLVVAIAQQWPRNCRRGPADAWFLVGEIDECFSDSDGELHLMTYHARKSLPFVQWEFQDPKMEVLRLLPYKAIFWLYIPLHRPYIGFICGRYLRFRYLKWPLIRWRLICYDFCVCMIWYVYVVDFYCMLRYQPCNCEAELNPWSQAHGRKVSPKCAPGGTSAAEGFGSKTSWPNLAEELRTTMTYHDFMSSCHKCI